MKKEELEALEIRRNKGEWLLRKIQELQEVVEWLEHHQKCCETEDIDEQLELTMVSHHVHRKECRLGSPAIPLLLKIVRDELQQTQRRFDAL